MNINFENATVYFKDGHEEKCTVVRPFKDDEFEFCVSSGLYKHNHFHFYKYYSDFVKCEISISGHTEYDSSDCWIIDDLIDRVEIKAEEGKNNV